MSKMLCHLIYVKGWFVISVNNARSAEHPHGEKRTLIPTSYHTKKSIPDRFLNLRVKSKTIKLSKMNIKKYLHGLEVGKVFLNTYSTNYKGKK